MRESLRVVRFALIVVVGTNPARTALWLLSSMVLFSSGLVYALLSKHFVNAAVGHDPHHAAVLGLVFAAFIAFDILAGGVMLSTLPKLEESSVLEMDQRLMHTTLRLPSWLHSSRDVQDRLELLRQQRGGPIHLLYAGLIIVWTVGGLAVSLVLLARITGRLLLLAVCGVPLALARLQQTQRLLSVQQDMAEPRRISLALFRTSTDVKTAGELRVFGMGGLLISRWERVRGTTDRETDRRMLRATLPVSIGETVFGLAFAGALVLVTHRAVQGRASLGDLVLFTSLALSLVAEMSQLAGVFGWFGSVLGALQRYLWLQDLADRTDASARERAGGALLAAPPALVAGLRLEGVGFTHEGAARPALQEVDLVLPAGATVALVGENGAGKTTLTHLLLGLLSPTEGSVAVDGTVLARIDPVSWQAATSVVLQDHAKLELVAFESIGVGSLPHLDDRLHVEGAVTRAAAGVVVAELPDGLDSALGSSYGQAGRELSGGQWQRLAVARGLMRERPLLLVMDEPTAALDAHAESELFASYGAAAQRSADQTGGITVLVSHRFSTVRTADLIVVLAEGRVVEQGDHVTLMARNGLYAELYSLQADGYR